MFLIAALTSCCTLLGFVHSSTGAPIAGARVAVHGPASATTTSGPDGKFSLHVDGGSYTIVASAAGFASADVGPVPVDHDVSVDVALDPADAQHLRPIGEVSVDGRLALSRVTIPSVVLNRSDFERRGFDRIIDALTEVPSVTLPRPDGGSAAAPAVVALRGPDPSETLVTLDGQLLNDANTGDLDLSRFPVAAFSAIDVTEGLGPRDLDGSNTIGGALNLVSLRPTAQLHTAYSFSTGSFGSSEGWFNMTGTRGKLGYAFALDDQQETGYVNQTDTLEVCTPDPVTCPVPAVPLHLGSNISNRAALANLIWNFSQRSDIGVRIFTLGNSRDVSAAVNAPDPASSSGQFIGPGTAVFAQSVRSYDVHARFGLGAGSLLGDFSASNNNVDYTGGTPSSLYDVAHQDKRHTATLSWQRSFDTADYELGALFRHETLAEAGVEGVQAQNITSFFVRGAYQASQRLHLNASAYSTTYSTFGNSVDGRLGISYDLDSKSSLRFNVGTGFRAPLLIERYVFPAASLVPDSNCVLLGQGNPNERPEHATEYELGYGRKTSNYATVDVSLYRTNLRDPIENFYPVGPYGTPPCAADQTTLPQSYPINIASVVYEGGAIKYAQRFASNFTLSMQYGDNIAYPVGFPSVTVSNPTSGGLLVNGRQFITIPQQVGSVGLDYDNGVSHAALDAVFRGRNNELNQGPYTLIDGGIGRRFGRADVTLAVTNLGNDVSGKFTAINGGVPYLGNVMLPDGSTGIGNIPTNRYVVEPRGFRLIFTVRN